MSGQATGWAWQQSAGKNKMLLLALAEFANDRGETRIDIEMLAEMTDKHRSTVCRQLADLEAEGFITRDDAHTRTGQQLVSVTRLLIRGPVAERPAYAAPAMRRRQEKPVFEAVAKCDPPQENVVFGAVAKCDPPAETPCLGPSHFATPTLEPGEEGGSQNATHKGKDIYSLSKTISNNINTISEGLSTGTHDEDVVVGAGLENLWKDWANASNANPVTLARQQAAWAGWVREGHADLLRKAAGEVLDLGSYAHPHAGVVKKMRTGITAKAGSSAAGAAGGGQSGPTCAPGERRQAPDGQVWTVESVMNGAVNFEEYEAPPYVPVAVVLTWAVLT